MHINQMRLVNYRNYTDASPVFSPGINILYGDNGQGKTNLLESVFLMCRGYSHRAGSIRELIGFGQESMFAAADFRTGSTSHRLSLKAVKGKRGWKFDGSSENSFARIQSYTGCILFEPDDLEIVKGGPDIRRRFINYELSGLVPGYKKVYREYERIRQQRNALLKQSRLGHFDLSVLQASLTPWDRQLVEAGSRIFALRQNYLSQLNKNAEQFHSGLAGTEEKLGLSYKTNVFGLDLPEKEEDFRALYQKALTNDLENDLERGFTRMGPHADDLVININDHPARLYASQGQQRTAAISLKLAHINLYKDNLNLTPIVLLDDILSELDDSRQKNILSVLKETQTFITCTNPSFSAHLGQQINKLHISDGNITQG